MLNETQLEDGESEITISMHSKSLMSCATVRHALGTRRYEQDGTLLITGIPTEMRVMQVSQWIKKITDQEPNSKNRLCQF